MYIYENEIEKFQEKGYVLMDVLDVELFKNKLAIYNYNFLETTKKELIFYGLDLNNHDLKDSLNKYLKNKNLDNTIFLFKENFLTKGLINQYLQKIQNKEEFIPIYLTSVFFKDNYLKTYENIKEIKTMSSLEKLERLFYSNEKRINLYKFLSKKENMFIINNYLNNFLNNKEKINKIINEGDYSDNEKNQLVYKKIKIKEFLECLLFLSKKEINPSLVNNLIYSLYFNELNFLFDVLLYDFEKNMNHIFKELNISNDYKRNDVISKFETIIEGYEKYNKIIELIEISRIMKRKFLVHHSNHLDVLFVID